MIEHAARPGTVDRLNCVTDIRRVPKTLSQSEFMTEVQKMSQYKEYSGIVHSAAAQAWSLATFECECLRKDARGFYDSKIDLGEKDLKFQPGSAIKFQDEDKRKAFFNKNSRSPSTFLIYEMDKIERRQRYLVDLASRAKAGKLSENLTNNVLAESTYYAAPPGPAWVNMNMQQKIKAWPPPQPSVASTPSASDTARTKAKAWVSKLSPESVKVVDSYAKTAGGWPLGHDITILREINKWLAPDAPLFRQVGASTLYPSSIGGSFLLKSIMEGFKSRTVPARGNAAWENWALYLFGAIMTSQGFTDGNKRVARAAYAIMMVSGGVQFRAMNDAYGASLGPM